MQIRLTVLGPQSGAGSGADVTVSAPDGTTLSGILGGLADTVSPGGGPPGAVYCGAVRLEPQRCVLGHPPLVDGAVLSFQRPADPVVAGVAVTAGSPAAGLLHRTGPDRADDGPARGPAHATDGIPGADGARARLLVVCGPDAGGVHLLHGGDIRLGRSAEAEVPIDDPDVSRQHCVITVPADGAPLTLRDAGSTNGTALDGQVVGERPVPVPEEAELRIGESVLRLITHSAPAPAAAVPPRAVEDQAPSLPAPRSDTPRSVADPRTGPTGPAGAAAAAHDADSRGPHRSPAAGRRADSAHDDGAHSTLAGRRRATAPALPPAPDRAALPAADTEAGRWPDLAEVLLAAVRPSRRLWERDAGHRDAMTVRLGVAQRATGPLSPVTVNLSAAGSLGLAGPRARLLALTRSVLAQLAALHRPESLEIVVLAPGRAADWSWLGWLPQTRPADGQDCHRLLAFDQEQTAARLSELTARLRPDSRVPAAGRQDTVDDDGAAGRRTVVLVDMGPEEMSPPSRLREPLTRLTEAGPAAGIHLLCLAEAPSATPASPVPATLAAAHRSAPLFGACGMVGVLAGEVATTVRLLLPNGEAGPPATLDGVSAPWAERLARALAPLPDLCASEAGEQVGPVTLPETARLLDVLELPRVTPNALQDRWAAHEGLPVALGAGGNGPVLLDLAAADGPLLVDGPPRSGRTELLCSLAASLAAGRSPRELSLLLVDGADEGLRACAELPHVVDRLRTTDPLRMRAFAQELRGELNRRVALLGEYDFEDWPPPAARAEPPAHLRVVGPRSAGDDAAPTAAVLTDDPLPRLVVLADDVAALRNPALGAPGRQAAGSVVRALEAVVREGARLGVTLIAAAEPAAWQQAVRVRLAGHPPGRAELATGDGRVEMFQAGRVTSRIPRTATLRPTVVRLDWRRAGDPPTRRPVRELGNGPTDIALLASAATRAGRPSGARQAVSPA